MRIVLRILLLSSGAATVVAMASSTTAAEPQAGGPLARALASALATPGVDPRRTAAVVVDLETRHTVFVRNPRRSLVPASNAKLPIAFAALAALGPSFRMHTDVLGRGRLVARTVWRGSLILKGYGDPALSSAGLGRLARRVRALGIRRVTGPIVGDDSFFDRQRTAPGWKPSFLIEESPPLGALVVDRGRIAGRAASEPALAAAVAFRNALRRAGVVVGGPVKAVRAGGVTLARLVSPPLEKLLTVVNAESDNYTAELLLKQLGAVLAGRGTSGAGAAAVRQVLAEHGVPLAGVRIADGSGLSTLDRLTAQALAAILVEAWHDRQLKPHFVPSLALAGRSGTLERRLGTPPTLGNVRAKTGTTDAASALAGYARKRYAFVVIHNGSPVATVAARAAQDRVATLLAAP